MKKADLKVGQILKNTWDDRTPYMLVLSINSINFAYLRSHDPNSFWISVSAQFNPDGPMYFGSFRDLRRVKIVA